MRRPERRRVPQSKRLLPPLKPWRYPTFQLMNWVRRLTRSGPHARRLPKESKRSRPVSWSAGGNGHGCPARSENSCWTTRGCAMRCAGPCSIAERLGTSEWLKAGMSMQPSDGRARVSRSLRDRRGTMISPSLPGSTAAPVLRDCWPDFVRRALILPVLAPRGRCAVTGKVSSSSLHICRLGRMNTQTTTRPEPVYPYVLSSRRRSVRRRAK
jgi:hypothetical protein